MTVEAPALPRPVGARYDRPFYTGMAIAAAVVVFIGFAPTYFLRASYQSTSLPTYLQVHGFLFTMWIALFIAQTTLVAARRTNLHRRLGWATASLAVVMVVVGTTAGIWSMRRQVEAGFAQQAQAFLTTPLFSAVARLPFEFLRTSNWNYLPTTDVFLAAAILYDLASRQTVHRAYIWGGALLVIEQALRIPVGETAAWQAIASAILGNP